MRKKEASGKKERFPVGHILEHLNRPRRYLPVAFRRVVIVERPNAPIHKRMISERRGRNQLFRRHRYAEPSASAPMLKLGIRRIRWLSTKTVVNFPVAVSLIPVVGKVLGQ